MAEFININDTFDFNLGTALKKLDVTLVKGDAGAHKINITVTRGGTPADLSGMACIGLFVNSKKHTVPVVCTVAGSVASVELGAACYAVQGPILMMLQLNDTTIFYANAYVQDGATDVFYDPEDILPSLRAVIENLVLCGTAAETANNAAALALSTIDNAAAAIVLANAAASDAALKASLAYQSSLDARAAALATAEGSAPVLANFLARENLNYRWITWGTEGKRINSSGVLVDAAGYIVSNPILITAGDYPYLSGGAWVERFAVYDAADDSYLGYLNGGYPCADAASEMYCRLSAVAATAPAKVLFEQTPFNASTDEYAFFDRNLQGIQINENMKGITINGRARSAADYDVTSGSLPHFGIVYGGYTFPHELKHLRTYCFLRVETPAGETLTYDAEVLFANDAPVAAYSEIISKTDNCVLAQFIGEDAECNIYPYIYLTNIKDSQNNNYTAGAIRCVQLCYFNSELHPKHIFEVMKNGNRVEDLARRYMDEQSKNDPFGRTFLWSDGDSLTAGLGIEPDPETAKLPAYPVLAAKRLGMTLYNGAISGSTMARCLVNGSDFYSFVLRYTYLPEYTDYLTLYFGRNDYTRGPRAWRDIYCMSEFANYYDACTTEQKAQANAQGGYDEAFIGTIGNEDIDTWTGAWEFIFMMLLTDYPSAKVGVIIPELPDDTLGNGMRQRLMDLCEMYRFPYLDAADRNAWLDVGMFPYGGTPTAIQVARRTAYSVDDIHPNAEGHYRQSLQYEAFLRRL